MDTLDEYFQGPYLDEKREIKHIDNLLLEILPIYDNFYDKNGWPYEIVDGKDVEFQRKISFSTSSMILYVMALVLGRLRNSTLLPAMDCYIPFAKEKNSAKVNFEKVFKKGFSNVIRNSQKQKSRGGRDKVFSSESFGDNDPFTMTWFLELVINIGEHDAKLKKNIYSFDKFQKKLIKCALDLVKIVFETPHEPFLKWEERTGTPRKTPVDHAFPLLRAIHLFKILSNLKSPLLNPGQLRTVKQHLRDRLRPHLLLSRIHQYLSFYDITDSMFDAAELVFYIEGILLVDKMLYEWKNVFSDITNQKADLRVLDKNLLDRAFNVIEESQKRSPYWRPLKPFVTTPQGLALLPLSVEIANSLLRVCKLLETDDEATNYFSKHVDLFKRYAAWLYTRVARGTPHVIGNNKPAHFCGWHSEHVHVPRKIHPWETSQVIIFLMQYQAMLQDHIARTSLKKANLFVDKVKRQNGKLSFLDYWQQQCETKEPLLRLSQESPYKAFAKIRTHYIKPRIDGDTYLIGERKPKCSMLLYGPPGTGKSSIAEDLAKTLNWRLIRIAPSDFIARGEAEVEARAKNIFQTLGEQDNVVILFDEIDRLILDRDSKLYREQSDIFKFMTPGMLVKLNKLWEKHSSIFLIVTNYEEHIDAAAKRTGRIDHKFLITPPDKGQRFEIFKHEIKEELKKEWPGRQSSLRTIVKELTRKRLQPIINLTALWTYVELKKLVDDALDKFLKMHGVKGVDNLTKVLIDVSKEQEEPAIRLTSYQNRFRSLGKNENSKEKENRDKEFAASQEPFSEFFLLLYLKLEVVDIQNLTNDISVIRQALNRIIPEGDLTLLKSAKVNGVRESLSQYVKDESVIDLLLRKLKKIEWGN
jgi:adenylate kinase family enzyme